MGVDRRQFLKRSGAATATAAATWAGSAALIQRALAVEPHAPTGSLHDIAHVVVLTQENRSFDHYFGALRGVRGLADRWARPTDATPFHLDTQRDFRLMRAEGNPHTWLDAQTAWDHGRMDRWAQIKGAQSMGYYTRDDMPFHYALADAFTVCDAYHCSFQGGTNTNRLFLWTGTNDPHAQGNGPATYNELDTLKPKPGHAAYTWTTYAERLQAAGVTWQVYQSMADNYSDNPLAGFQVFRDAHQGKGPIATELKQRALSSRTLRHLHDDVMANRLPRVSWIVAGAKDCEHPEHSSPAQGAQLTARVLAALTANPDVWARTVLIINFDENDGYYDHVPPPAPPSYTTWDADPAKAVLAGASTVDTRGEYHEHLAPYHAGKAQQQALLHRPYGLGPRVPMLVVSPWSRGGWVNSQVFDHTSVIRFMARCFGVDEPQISPWRRAVCGDLTSTLRLGQHDATVPGLPDTAANARRAAALPRRTMPKVPPTPEPLAFEPGTRPSCALPYALHAHLQTASADGSVRIEMGNTGDAGVVFHVYDVLHPRSIPRRYTVEPGKFLTGVWNTAATQDPYDLWLLGPNGFHRRFQGRVGAVFSQVPTVTLRPRRDGRALDIDMTNDQTPMPIQIDIVAQTYPMPATRRVTVRAKDTVSLIWDTTATSGWYDFELQVVGQSDWRQRFAGRLENGQPSISDPAGFSAAPTARAHPAHTPPVA